MKNKDKEFTNLELWIISIALGIMPISLILCWFYLWGML